MGFLWDRAEAEPSVVRVKRGGTLMDPHRYIEVSGMSQAWSMIVKSSYPVNIDTYLHHWPEPSMSHTHVGMPPDQTCRWQCVGSFSFDIQRNLLANDWKEFRKASWAGKNRFFGPRRIDQVAQTCAIRCSVIGHHSVAPLDGLRDSEKPVEASTHPVFCWQTLKEF